MNRKLLIQHAIVVFSLITSALFSGCDRPSNESHPATRIDSTSASPIAQGFLADSDWKSRAFGELAFRVHHDTNVLEAHFRKAQGETGVDVTLGTKTWIPVLRVLKDEALQFPEAMAIIRVDEKLFMVSETGRANGDLDSINVSPATVNRIHQIFSEHAMPAEHAIDKGMYEGIVVLFPASAIPLRTVDAVKSSLRRLLIELILDKVKRMTGNGSETFEARLHARIVSKSQRLLFLPDFPLFVCKDANGSLDPIKAMQLMMDPAEARKAQENAKLMPLTHDAEAGLVVAIERNEVGFRIVVQTGASNQSHTNVYTGVLATNLKVGDLVNPKQLIGVVNNPKIDQSMKVAMTINQPNSSA